MRLDPGPRNLITDVDGLIVGNAQDETLKSGVSVLTAAQPFVAGVHVMGGAPGTRETDLLAPDRTVQQVDALVLSGGSALGLAAASGVADALRAEGRGFAVGDQRVPIVPAAILFDLINGGAKHWAENPYPDLGRAALANAGPDFAIGSIGAGTGALTADLKGGLGSASLRLPGGHMLGALVAVNAMGAATSGPDGRFWAAPFEMGGEFGARGMVNTSDPHSLPPIKGGGGQNTTIAIIATDATLTQAQATRLATAAHAGLARAILPSHTPMDGDLVFAAATGAREMADPVADMIMLCHGAAICLARAIARAVFAASAAPGDLLPTWQDRFGR